MWSQKKKVPKVKDSGGGGSTGFVAPTLRGTGDIDALLRESERRDQEEKKPQKREQESNQGICGCW